MQVVILRRNSNLFKLTLINERTGNAINDATPTATVTTVGDEVLIASTPFVYEPDSEGVYYATINVDDELDGISRGRLVIADDTDGLVLDMKPRAYFVDRTGCCGGCE